ncbi:DUF6090 family protein [Winogradskyella sp. A3E31]|uniref:DUF6090 family protein n=1 Tax=Winogradskyella sp. A3E31 TaxID=3349637 RepID=UPI00398AA0D9
MEKGKTSRYLKYAIGEIILVVIGILIALQINNWNEEKETTRKTNKLLEDVLQDLEFDIKVIQETLEYYNAKDSIIHLVNEKGLDYYKDSTSIYLGYQAIPMQIRVLAFRKRSYEQLKSMSALIPQSHEKIFAEIVDLYEPTDLYKNNFQPILDEEYAELHKKEWFSEGLTVDNGLNPKLLNYMENDAIRKNRIVRYHNAIHNSLNVIFNYYVQGQITYKNIAKFLNKEEIPSFFSVSQLEEEDVEQLEGTYCCIRNQELTIKPIEGELKLIGFNFDLNLYKYGDNAYVGIGDEYTNRTFSIDPYTQELKFFEFQQQLYQLEKTTNSDD